MLPIWAVIVFQLAAGDAAVPVPDTTRRATQYRVQRWTDTDGLPQNSISSVARTADGFVWLASEEGLIRFDGARFRVLNPTNTPSLLRSQMLSLAASHDGALWIGTAGSGLLRHEGGGFRAYTIHNGLPSDRVQAVAVERGGSAWAGTNAGVVRVDTAGQVTIYNRANGLPADEILAIATTAVGDVWVGTPAGLVRITGGKIRVYDADDGVRGAVRAVSAARRGGVWVGTNAGVMHFDGTQFRPLDARLSDAVVTAIAEEPNGAVWVGTNSHGLHRWLNGRLETLNNSNGAADIIWSLDVDTDGIVWAGTNGRGLIQLRQAPFVPFGTPEGLSGDITLAVLETRNGDRWIGTAGAGLNRVSANGAITRFGPSTGFDARVIVSLAELPNGDVLAGAQMGFLARYTNGRFTEIGTRLGLRHSVMAILPDTAGGFWLGLAGGGVVHVDRAGSQAAIGVDEGLAENFVMALHRTSSGVLWAGTRQGVSRIVNGRATDVQAVRQTAGVAIAGFHARPDGSVWAATQGRGVVRIAGDSAVFVDRSHGLCEDLIHAIVDDGAGTIWMSSNKGIFRVPTRELEEFFEARRTRIGCVLYDTGAGMRSREANGGFMPAAAHLRDGRLMFPTMQGVVTFDPAAFRSAVRLPHVVIETAVLGVDTMPLPAGTPLRVQTADRNVEIHFTAPFFRAPDRLRFRFMLEGFDKDWQTAGSLRTAYYTNLPPGEYRFHVMVGDDEAGWREGEAVLPVVVPAHYYETWWFYLLCGLALAACAWSVHRHRLNVAARNAARLSALVDERTRAEERYRDLFENASDMVFTSSLDGTVLSWNAEAERLTGFQKHEAIGSSIGSILPQIGDISNMARRDITFTRRNGEPAAIEIAARVIREDDVAVGYQVIGRDVYEWRRMQMQLQQAAKMEAIGQLAGGVAHDFNNLLTVITSASEMVRSELPEHSPLRGDIDQVRAAADNAAALTRQLLAFSRRQVLQPRILDMNKKVTNVVAMLRRVIGVNIAVETDLISELWPVYADAVQLEQVLMNLALNARDAMPKGGILRLRTRNADMSAATARALRIPAGRYIELAVEDTGLGIDPAIVPHLFEPFFTTKDSGIGTGLGLATVYGVVKQSGGHVVVDSRPGSGTRFVVYLPAADAAKSAEPVEARTESRANAMRHATILLVDDEPAVSHLANKILARSGFSVKTAPTGREALRILDEIGPVDLLLTDIMMPGMNGRELAHAVLKRHTGTAILYMSGYTEDEVIRRGELPHGEQFISKPFTPAGLVNAVLAALKVEAATFERRRAGGAA